MSAIVLAPESEDLGVERITENYLITESDSGYESAKSGDEDEIPKPEGDEDEIPKPEGDEDEIPKPEGDEEKSQSQKVMKMKSQRRKVNLN